MPILYILCGPSGSGKSTWGLNFLSQVENTMYTSRDYFRLSMLKDGEDYFSHEKEVFKQFVNAIVNSLTHDINIIADATHLNEFSRRKLTQAIDMFIQDYQIVYVIFNTNLKTCLERNAQRTGRANVPETVIRNMFKEFKVPTLDEDERAIDIMEINDD